MEQSFVAYTPSMMPALLDIWNAATGGDLPLGEALWRQNIENHPLFQPKDCLVAIADDGGLAGFTITRIVPEAELRANPDMAQYREWGHVMALAVQPYYQRRGIGSRLLATAEERLRAEGATKIALWGPPGCLAPGPPAKEELRTFFQKRGYQLDHVTYDLRRQMDDWQQQYPPPPLDFVPEEFTLTQGQEGEQALILDFLAAAFPGGWRYHVAHAFVRGYSPEDITLLRHRSGKIKGFLCASHPGSSFLGGGGSFCLPQMRSGAWGAVGPLGISADVRGRGLGLALVAAAISYLYSRGVRDCAVGWTTLLDFYGRLGFAIWKSYYIMEKA